MVFLIHIELRYTVNHTSELIISSYCIVVGLCVDATTLVLKLIISSYCIVVGLCVDATTLVLKLIISSYCIVADLCVDATTLVLNLYINNRVENRRHYDYNYSK